MGPMTVVDHVVDDVGAEPSGQATATTGRVTDSGDVGPGPHRAGPGPDAVDRGGTEPVEHERTRQRRTHRDQRWAQLGPGGQDLVAHQRAQRVGHDHLGIGTQDPVDPVADRVAHITCGEEPTDLVQHALVRRLTHCVGQRAELVHTGDRVQHVHEPAALCQLSGIDRLTTIGIQSEQVAVERGLDVIG